MLLAAAAAASGVAVTVAVVFVVLVVVGALLAETAPPLLPLLPPPTRSCGGGGGGCRLCARVSGARAVPAVVVVVVTLFGADLSRSRSEVLFSLYAFYPGEGPRSPTLPSNSTFFPSFFFSFFIFHSFARRYVRANDCGTGGCLKQKKTESAKGKQR